MNHYLFLLTAVIQIFFIILFFNIFNNYFLKNNSDKAFKEVGGISIFLTISLSFLYFEYNYFISLLILTSSIIVFVGFLDDIYNLKAILRTIMQIFTIYILIFFGYQISNTGYFDLNNYHYLFGFLFTIFCVILLINAINFLDGLDGTAGFNLILSFLMIIIYSFIFSREISIFFVIVIIFTLTIFLFFNLKLKFTYHIYLGDAGSNFFGYILAWLLIYYTSPEINLFPPALAIWIIAYPMFDMLAIIIKRSLNKQHPYTKDNNHNHHNLLRLGYSSIQVNLIISLISLFLSFIGILSFKYFGENIAILLYILCFFIYYFLFYYNSQFYKKDL